MLGFMKKKAKKPGLSPGTLVHIGEKKAEKVKITVIDYDEGYYEEKELDTVEAVFLLQVEADNDMDQHRRHPSSGHD